MLSHFTWAELKTPVIKLLMSGVTTICQMSFVLITLLIVVWGMLVQVAVYWQELEHAVVSIESMPEDPKPAQWVASPVSMLALQDFSFHE